MLSIFNSAVALAGVFATLALANPEPQTPAQTTAAVNAIVSYAESLETDPALLSIVSVFETNPAALSTIQQVEASLASAVQAGKTPATDFISALPTEVQSFFGSVYTAELSIVSANGFTSQAAQITGTKSGAAASTKSDNAAPTAAALGLSAGALAGVVGIVMAL